MRIRNISIYILVLASMFFNSITLAQDVTFTDITKEAGIKFQYNFGDYTYENILESSGSGISIFDYNGDEYMDLYLLNGTYLEGISDAEGKVFENTPNELYRNNGDGTFTEVAATAGIDHRQWSMAAGPLDYDGDGDVDLYLLNYGPNVFYRNEGDGTFTDIADQLGLRGPDKLNGFLKWSVGVAYWDIDHDQDVDMMVGNFLAFDPEYVSPTMPGMMPHPSEYKGQASLFYRQEPDGTFTEITRELGFYYPESMCMGLTTWDYDDDGDIDLFQGNDHQLNFLFRNDGDLKFEEVAIASGIAANDQGLPTGSMHGSVGDVDGDGLLDLLVTDLRWGAMYRNKGNGFYEDITQKSGITDAFRGKGEWAAVFVDYDNDGDLDLISANGNGEELILQLPLFLENDGRGVFRNAGPELSDYFKKKRSGRAAASWDFDNDGDRDIIVSHIDMEASPVFLRNDGGNQNNWLGITLIGNTGSASAIAAKVTVYTGKRKQVLLNQRASSYLSYHDPRLHIGLGKSEKIDKMEIWWPNNEVETYRDIQVNQYVKIKQGRGISDL